MANEHMRVRPGEKPGVVIGWLDPSQGGKRATRVDPVAIQATLDAGHFRVTVDLAKDEYCSIEILDMVNGRAYPVFKDHISHMIAERSGY